jgi:hypothetical protein
VKDAFAVLSEGDDELTKKAYTNIYKELYHWEFVFYNDLIQKKIPERSLFVMKTIGDEIWMVIDLEELRDLSLTAVISEVVCSLNKTFLTRKIEVACPMPEIFVEEQTTKKRQSRQRYLRKSIFFKIFMDVIEKKNLVDLSSIRAEVFDKMYKDNDRTSSGGEADRFAHSLNRFGVGSSVARGKTVETKLRKDYVGTQIDRFFRCTSFALPSLICIGRNCVNILKSQPNNKVFPSGNGVLSNLRLWNANKKNSKFDSFQAFRMPIVPGELRGISGDYSVIYLFSNLKLLGLNFNDVWANETKKIMSKHGITWDKIVRSSSISASMKKSLIGPVSRSS